MIRWDRRAVTNPETSPGTQSDKRSSAKPADQARRSGTCVVGMAGGTYKAIP
jgi:hypothetical protein